MTQNNQTMLELYKNMLLIRRFEESVALEYRNGKIPGFVHTSIGQEAVAVGVSAHLNNDDYVTSTHRGHGHALAKGAPPHELMAELYGRETGCSGGRGGSMHVFFPEIGFLGSNGIVGSSILHAAGAAFASQYRGDTRVAVAFFGDGGVNTGSFHEGLNLAAILNLPIVFICENNLYATQMPFKRATAGQSVAKRAEAYAFPGISLDGQDVMAIYDKAGEAIMRARNGKGPTLIECLTYRYSGHNEGDPGTSYRPMEEIEEWKRRDPLRLLQNKLLSNDNDIDLTFLKSFEDEITKVIREAVDFAEQSPWPDAKSATKNVFSTDIV